MKIKPIYKTDFLDLFHCDNMELMASYPDKYFDLAIVDPEFGIGIGKSPRLVTDKGLKAKDWDNKPIDMKYFDEVFRTSKQQIIWGGNYYALPPTKHCIIWDKKQPEKLSFGMFDFAWSSFEGANKIFRKSVQDEQNKIHPTQKPVALYEWLLTNYAKKGQKVFDSHLGSASSAIAAHYFGVDFVGTELDKDYFDAAKARFDMATKQLAMSI